MKDNIDEFMLLRDYAIKVVSLRDEALQDKKITLTSRVASVSNKLDATNANAFTELAGDSKFVEICSLLKAARTNVQFNAATSLLEDHYYHILKTDNL